MLHNKLQSSKIFPKILFLVLLCIAFNAIYAHYSPQEINKKLIVPKDRTEKPKEEWSTIPGRKTIFLSEEDKKKQDEVSRIQKDIEQSVERSMQGFEKTLDVKEAFVKRIFENTGIDNIIEGFKKYILIFAGIISCIIWALRSIKSTKTPTELLKEFLFIFGLTTVLPAVLQYLIAANHVIEESVPIIQPHIFSDILKCAGRLVVNIMLDKAGDKLSAIPFIGSFSNILKPSPYETVGLLILSALYFVDLFIVLTIKVEQIFSLKAFLMIMPITISAILVAKEEQRQDKIYKAVALLLTLLIIMPMTTIVINAINNLYDLSIITLGGLTQNISNDMARNTIETVTNYVDMALGVLGLDYVYKIPIVAICILLKLKYVRVIKDLIWKAIF